MAEPQDDRSAMAVAFEWSATITTIALEMVVPGLVGYWLDQRLGTHVVFLLLGFALGGTLAALALAKIAKKGSGPSGRATGGPGSVGKSKHDHLE